MDTERIKASIQKDLETAGVPVSLASETAQILTEENRKSFNNEPVPERTQEEQHIVSSAWTWKNARRHEG
jgi:hypothetical protein